MEFKCTLCLVLSAKSVRLATFCSFSWTSSLFCAFCCSDFFKKNSTFCKLSIEYYVSFYILRTFLTHQKLLRSSFKYSLSKNIMFVYLNSFCAKYYGFNRCCIIMPVLYAQLPLSWINKGNIKDKLIYNTFENLASSIFFPPFLIALSAGFFFGISFS